MKKSFAARAILALLLISMAAGFGLRRAYLSAPRAAVRQVTAGRNRRTLILDPGHGGADGGAVSVTGTYESKLNLEIALRCRALAGLFGVTAELTRESEQLDYPKDANTIRAKKVWDTKARTERINALDNAVLISIHQNKYTTPSPHGSQVLYAPTDGSRELAEDLQALLTQATGESKRTAAKIGESIYIMNHVSCPAVLVECGFVSNAVEAKKLEEPAYQLKLAALIVGGYLNRMTT